MKNKFWYILGGTLFIILIIFLARFFVISKILIPKAIDNNLKESGIIEEVDHKINEMGLNLTKDDFMELREAVKGVKSDQIRKMLTQFQNTPNNISNGEFLEIINSILEFDSLDCIESNGGWDNVKQKIANELNDSDIKKCAHFLKNNREIRTDINLFTESLKLGAIKLIDSLIDKHGELK